MIIDQCDLMSLPDGFMGSIFAFEGITDAATILNGPTGCKMHLGEYCKDLFKRENDQSSMRWAEEFFFGQDRLPCTYVDDYDYVYGTAEKLEYVFPRVAAKGYAFIGVLNSPGASLIGDDLQRYLDWSGLKTPATVLDRPHFGESFAAGWLDAACTALDVLQPAAVAVQPRTINFVGLGIWHRHWAGSRAELERLLALCGVRVHAVLLADCPSAQIRNLRSAACNVVVHDETGVGLARHLESRYGMPWVASEAGAPVGFDATEAWLRTVCGAVGADPAPALAAVAADRTRAAEKLYRCTAKIGYPRGATFGIALDASLALPLTRWLDGYLGMVPVAVQVPDEDQPAAARLRAYLDGRGLEAAWNAPLDPADPPDAVLANDAMCMRLLRPDGLAPVCLDIAMPAKNTLHFTPRSVLGSSGALRLLEELCNGLWRVS